MGGCVLLTHRIALLSLFGRRRLSTLGPSFRRMRLEGMTRSCKPEARGVGGQAFKCDLISDQLRLDALAVTGAGLEHVDRPLTLCVTAILIGHLIHHLGQALVLHGVQATHESLPRRLIARCSRPIVKFTTSPDSMRVKVARLIFFPATLVFGWSPSRSKCNPASFTSSGQACSSTKPE